MLGKLSKSRLKAFLKSLGKVYANSRLSVIMRMESAEKLFQICRMPKHWANAQQCFAGCKRQISAFAAAENDRFIRRPPF